MILSGSNVIQRRWQDVKPIQRRIHTVTRQRCVSVSISVSVRLEVKKQVVGGGPHNIRVNTQKRDIVDFKHIRLGCGELNIIGLNTPTDTRSARQFIAYSRISEMPTSSFLQVKPDSITKVGHEGPRDNIHPRIAGADEYIAPTQCLHQLIFPHHRVKHACMRPPHSRRHGHWRVPIVNISSRIIS